VAGEVAPQLMKQQLGRQEAMQRLQTLQQLVVMGL
jgi:hypothetical protein